MAENLVSCRGTLVLLGGLSFLQEKRCTPHRAAFSPVGRIQHVGPGLFVIGRDSVTDLISVVVLSVFRFSVNLLFFGK